MSLDLAFIAPTPGLPIFNVQDYGARGDGSTDDTSAIQAAITAAIAAHGIVFFPPNTYKVSGNGPTISASSNVSVVGYGATIQLASGGKFGIQLSGSNTYLTISGLTIIGDGTSASCGIGTVVDGAAGTASGTNITIRDANISNCQRGINLAIPGGGARGDWKYILIDNCYVSTIYGESSGQGYGIATDGWWDSSIQNCRITLTQRHGIYVSASDRITVSGNTVSYNRIQNNTTNDQFGGIEVARSRKVTVIGNHLIGNWHGQMSLEPEDISANTDSYDLIVIGNTFEQARDQDLFIGGPGADATNPFYNVVVANNTFRRPDITVGGVTASLNVGVAIQINHGNRIDIHDNIFWAGNTYTAQYGLITTGSGISASFMTQVAIHNNSALVTASGVPSFFNLINTNACTSTSMIRIESNDLQLTGTAVFSNVYNATRTNPNIVVANNTYDDNSGNWGAFTRPFRFDWRRGDLIGVYGASMGAISATNLTARFGSPTFVGPGFLGMANVSGSTASQYMAFTDGTNWYYLLGTLAV